MIISLAAAELSFITMYSLFLLLKKLSKAGIPNLQDLMPDDLKWRWCNNNRDKVHSKGNLFESSWNHPPPPDPWKNCLPWNWSLLPKRMGVTDIRQGWTNYCPQAKFRPPPIYVNSYTGTQPPSFFIHFPRAVFLWQWQSWVIAIETIQ